MTKMNIENTVESGEEDQDQGDGAFGVELSFFVDREAVVAAIKEICSANWLTAFTEKFEWLVATLSKYQEQPTLLNPHLSEMLTPMTERMITISTAVALDKTRTSLFQVISNPCIKLCDVKKASSHSFLMKI
jgi:hypothetical protein